MTPEERYINFIVEDLVKNTKVDNTLLLLPYPSTLKSRYSIDRLKYQRSFYIHIMERYGVRQEEKQIIFDLYKKKLIDLYKI